MKEARQMGYGLGGFLIALGLILALAVQDSVSGVDLTMVGWILAAVGAVLLAVTAFTLNGGRTRKTEAVTTHPDGTQSAHEQRSVM